MWNGTNKNSLRSNTVLSGVVDASNLPGFLAIGTGLAVNLVATTPLIVSFANGFGVDGESEYICRIAANLASAWSSLTDNTTCYLYIERNATTGAITYGFTATKPKYVMVGVAGTAGHYFEIPTRKMKYSNGATLVDKQIVFVGECVTASGTVSSVTPYAFNGEYIMTNNVIAASTIYTYNHNIGTDLVEAQVSTSLGGGDMRKDCAVTELAYKTVKFTSPAGSPRYATVIVRRTF